MDAIKNASFCVLLAAILGCAWLTIRARMSRAEWRKAYEAIRVRAIHENDAFAPFGLVALFTVSTLLAGGAPQAPEANPISFVVGSLTLPIMLLATVFLPILIRNSGFRASLGTLSITRRDMATGVRSAFAMLLPMAALGALSILVERLFEGQVEQQALLNWIKEPETATWRKIFLVASAVLVSPIAEELTFRGVILAALSKRCGIVSAVLVSSLFFGAIHLSLDFFLPLSCAGACFALGYIATGRIGTSIAMHATFNAVSIACTFLGS